MSNSYICSSSIPIFRIYIARQIMNRSPFHCLNRLWN
nr:MAG TPA: hypothetical protein [Caudoviricetes sp.]DAU54205.1 MAG TPA: hypothetical protein [Bacteriophage sp.]